MFCWNFKNTQIALYCQLKKVLKRLLNILKIIFQNLLKRLFNKSLRVLIKVRVIYLWRIIIWSLISLISIMVLILLNWFRSGITDLDSLYRYWGAASFSETFLKILCLKYLYIYIHVGLNRPILFSIIIYLI